MDGIEGMHMKVGIIGGGAIGLLFAANLGKMYDVTLYVKRTAQKDSINSKGITLCYQEQKEVTWIKAESEFTALSQNDLLIIAVKQYHLADITETIRKLPIDLPLLFLQNGIGHIELLNNLPHSNLYVGTVEHGALKVSESKVAHKGRGKTNIAIFKGSDGLPGKLSNECVDFPFVIMPDYEMMLLEKLAINAVINPLTAVLGVRNGKLIENDEFEYLARAVFEEICLLYPKLNEVISFNDIKAVAFNTRGNTSSMLADLQADRQTEIDAILGAVIARADQDQVPISFIRYLYKMVKGLDVERRKG
ncbi:2-dehydropantoate 2-reductase [Bacillus salacetis]|uniref:2-dehydropantoate 2-reductase n=1 Tax=Bacillus salacetis TaxID=2315464 RepID=A0A3A1R603_9BACI|nr:2-dehydropantoate 2-reductase [Bacillus salacetis]RIW36310.1 2-dehydropantoate 2-reductase [Bacillus salacetis]